MLAMTTILTETAHHDVDARWSGGSILVAPDALAALTGFSLEPAGLCRGDVCIPTRSHPGLRSEGGVDLGIAAELLDRPLAVDATAQVAVLGGSAAARASQLVDGRLGDLVLHDLDGRPVPWPSIGRKKKVLVAWASW
jgi:hypothetical protein